MPFLDPPQCIIYYTRAQKRARLGAPKSAPKTGPVFQARLKKKTAKPLTSANIASAVKLGATRMHPNLSRNRRRHLWTNVPGALIHVFIGIWLCNFCGRASLSLYRRCRVVLEDGAKPLVVFISSHHCMVSNCALKPNAA